MELATTKATPQTISSGNLSSDFWFYVLTCAVCIFGIFANILAMFVLQRSRSSINKGHVLMLRCLFANDCVVLADKLVRTFMKYKWPSTENDLWMCRGRVLFRFFGWGSACVAVVMAIDRWLALTKPYFYEKHNTFGLLKRTMIILWLEILCLVCAPLIGFGHYWNTKSSTCEEVHEAKKPLDVLYSYLSIVHGVTFSIVIVYTNTAVMKALCMKDNLYNAATEEERSFIRLMLMLSVGLILFAIPRLLVTMLTTFIAEDESSILLSKTSADFLLVIHFALDPCLYVLQHWRLVKSICWWPKNKNNANNGSPSVSRSYSMRTTS